MTDMSQTRLRVLRGSIGHILELYGYGSGDGSRYGYGHGSVYGYGYGSGYGYGHGYGDGSGYGGPDNGLTTLPDSNREEVT